jgi:hypothetical protein
MNYTATTYNIMIASPGDVASEPTIVWDVVYDWIRLTRVRGV